MDEGYASREGYVCLQATQGRGRKQEAGRVISSFKGLSLWDWQNLILVAIFQAN